MKDSSPIKGETAEPQKKGMDEVLIYRFQARTIENALRLTMNVLGSRSEETAMDREIIRADKFIKEVLSKEDYRRLSSKEPWTALHEKLPGIGVEVILRGSRTDETDPEFFEITHWKRLPPSPPKEE